MAIPYIEFENNNLMNGLILPGNSQSNKPWTVEIDQQLSCYFQETKIIEYESWQSNDYGKVIDFPVELEKIKKAVANWDQYCVFAKSIGTALCIKAVHDQILSPQKCVFVGVPLNWLSTKNIPIKNWVSTYNIPTMVIQQRNDPFGNSNQVGEFLRGMPSISKYIVVSGNDHKYPQIDKITSKSLNYFKNYNLLYLVSLIF